MNPLNPILELKRRLTPRSRWGAIGLGPRREFGSLTWSEAEDRPQPQDGALTNHSFIGDEPEISPLPFKAEQIQEAKLPPQKTIKSLVALVRHPLR